MKNEIGRKLTSLTIMAIMFAGGMAIGVPSFMPEAASDLSVTEGLLTVSSTSIQGAAVLEIVVNDPDNATTSDEIGTLAASFGGTSYDLTQGSNGKWYLYVVDNSASTLLDADGTGWEFGIECSSGLGQKQTTSDLIVSGSHEVWASALAAVGEANVTSGTSAGGCLDIDNMRGTFDDASTTVVRQKLTDNILAGAPSLSNPGGSKANLGQNYHALNESGHGSWPYIISVDFTDDNEVAYGSDAINVVYGNTDDLTAISLANQNPSAGSEVHLEITDPGLNIDPTTADVWIFDLSDNGGAASSVIFGTNGTNTAMSAAELGDHACGENCQLSSDSETQFASGTTGTTTDGTVSTVQMTETGSNTGVFQSFGSNGNGEFEIKTDPTINDKTVFSYGGNSVDLIITYHDASISLDNGGGAWTSTQSATITVTDLDMNKNPSAAETLSTGDPNQIIPYIKMGSPLSLTNGANPSLNDGDSNAVTGVNIGEGSPGTEGASSYTLTITNASGGAERLNIVNTASPGNTAAATSTWINVTTGHTKADLIGLAGQVFLSYDISGPAGDMSSTDINVFVTDRGSNETNSHSTGDAKSGIIDIVTTGNVRSGVYDLCGSVGFGCLQDVDTDAVTTWKDSSGTYCTTCGNSTSLVTVAFEITHAAGNQLTDTHDFAIAADFCNFDQNNGSLTHNCIYRLNAVETGDDTGVFTGTVEYVNLVNSTGGTSGGSHAGGNTGAGGLATTNGDALTVVLQNAVSGSDSVRVVYGDTDGFKVATKIGAQLESSTVTGSISFDSDNYGSGDIGTITIVDSDLNQDSSTRDTYTNSSTTFKALILKSGDTTETEPFANLMTVIETEADSGVFVGSFIVPDRLGADMKLTYYEARDAAGSAVTYETNATISSNSGTVSLDRSVYPVPYVSGELNTGAGTASVNTEGGPVTVWITVTDADMTSDTLTTGSAAGTIEVNHVEGATTSKCFTLGGTLAYDGVANTLAAEAGPLSETSIGSQTYEVSISVTEALTCASADVTVQSGDVLQVKYVDAASDNGLAATTFDSATFDLRTGSLSVDKDVYVMGSDMVITVTDPDLNLDSATAESYAMSLIEWDSAADNTELLATSTADNTHTFFSHNPSSLEETGSNTGVFQTVTTLPALQVSATGTPEYGEKVTLTYQDVGLSGEDDVAGDTLDIETTFNISNFGAIIELDKAVYNWTDTVYVTITAPDHNNNTVAEETIGTAALPIQVTSRAGKMCATGTGSTFHIGAETGADTGVFTAEVLLTGYSLAAHNNPGTTTNVCSATDSTAGKLAMAGQTDGISVSYEYTDGVVVVSSASVMFNIAEAGWDTSSASAGGSAVISVTDADENIDSGIINSFSVAVFSDSDNGGISLNLHETDEDTGVFEGTVIFTADGATSGVNLRVSEGDTVTAEYSDKTLPEPYTDSDSLTLASTLTIGTAFPPLERAPAANARVVDAFGASVAEVSVDQQVQIAADVSNGQSGDQAFAYLVQVQDESGVTVSLAWITGSLTAGQSMSPALSWTPSASGSYTATVFVWESVDNPTALSPTTSVTIDVV